ncbi:hypothetical protein J4E93_009231 [Alternaria ventricosa]|uniref:uncharacterized protein n=1 Tax=Alternaria ventricosa TaxID=1187951 RepID=UPI0020C1C42E|nr:uncharacterized protein J4E93_009231 [Alternaria ventricosa]KAI4639403.1 hypothetical protein J4E93_009231 [Alternaria ventricosa]
MQNPTAQPQDEDQSKRAVDVEAGESEDAIRASRSSWWLRSWKDTINERANKKREQRSRKKEENEMIKAIVAILKKPYSVEVSDFPSGYPLQAALQSSTHDFAIYRNFSYLHSRVVLELQDQLRELEGRLHMLDKLHSESEDPEQRERVTSRVKDMEAAQMSRPVSNVVDDTATDVSVHRAERSQESDLVEQLDQKPMLSERAALLEKIQQKLVRYDEVLVHARRLAEFQRPTDDEWLNLRKWYFNRQTLSSDDEDGFIRMKHDLITLKPRTESGKIDDWIRRLLVILGKGKITVSIS